MVDLRSQEHQPQAVKQESAESPIRPRFKEVVLQVAENKRRAINPNIKELDLSEIDNDFEGLIDATLNDPDQNPHQSEAGKSIYALIGGTAKKMIVEVKHRFGKDNEFYTKGSANPKEGRHLVSVMHAHPKERPNSPTDLETLFLDSQEEASEIVSMVITPTTKILIFRGEKTPMYPPERAAEITAWWTELYEQLMSLYLREDTPKDEKDILSRNTQYKILYEQLTRDPFNLQIFTCPRGEKVARLYDPKQGPPFQ